MLNEKCFKGNKYMSEEFHVFNILLFVWKKLDIIQVKIESQFNSN
jgi:hypothetical protein